MPVLDQLSSGPTTTPEEEERNRQMMAAMMAAQDQEATSNFQATQAEAPVSMTQQAPQSSLPASQPPAVNLAHASMADQPAAADVTAAQGNLDKFQKTPLWKRAIVPAAIGAISAIGGRGWGGRDLQDSAQHDIQDYTGGLRNTRDSLIHQVEFAKQQQQQQFETDQRSRQQDIMAAGNNQTRTLMAQIAANSRENVAGTRADASLDVQDARNTGATQVQRLRNEGSLDVQDSRNQGSLDVANTQGKNRIEVARINAQAALSRFLAGEGRQDARQARGFEHTDLKPSADENRRADLSEAMIGYADMLSDIAQRRPELFGPLAGRATQARQWIGSDDPDVKNLKFLKEQLGIVQMGAHSMRSAQAIAPIADSLVNGFHDDAGALLSTISMAKKGVETFVNGPVRPNIYAAPAGNPAPANARPLRGKVAGSQPSAGGQFTALTVPVGQVYNGHKYVGGDRANPASWQAVAGGK